MSGGAEYNQGSADDKRKALDAAYDYNKTLITLATGTIALSATFLGTALYQGVELAWLIASWAVFGASIVLGLLGLGAYISQYAESDARPRRSAVEVFSLLQVLAVITGLALLGYFAIKNAEHRPRTQPNATTTTTTTTSTTTTSPASTTTSDGRG